jgi:hypothetical protein
MNPDRVKFYTELMKSLTAFILGTGAGIYALITNDNVHSNFLIFASTLCVLCVGVFVTLFVYIDKNMES